MKKVLSLALSVLIVASTLFVFPGVAADSKTTIPKNMAPINRDVIIEMLINNGTLSADATQAEITAALKAYVGNDNANAKKTTFQKMREGIIAERTQAVLSGNVFKGKKIGQGKNLPAATEIPYGASEKTVKVLVLLAEYDNFEHNSILKPADLTRNYWTADFNAEHYQQLLFGDENYETPEGTISATFKDYFRQQSNGNLNIEGQVYGWYKVGGEAADYGADKGDIHDINAADLIREAAQQAVDAGVDLSEYDIEDPYDLDGDGSLVGSDGIVDHLMVIHAGMGQEAGGGALEDDAIWSHSSSVGYDPHLLEGSDTTIYTYTVEAEDGAVGLFTHEFTHDLGMPDDYDTAYTADGDIVEYWSLMASGSWSGKPGGSMPTGINPYHRIQLGAIHGGDWINYQVVNYDDMNGTAELTLDTATLNTGNTQSLVIKLPEEKNILVINKPSEGIYEFGSIGGDEVFQTLTTEVDLTGKASAMLTYDTWFNIEEDWDLGCVQVSDDGGSTWSSLATPNTKDDVEYQYPGFDDLQPAYTGSSDGWITENIDLSAYDGKQIQIRFVYATDWGANTEGFFIDNISVVAGEEILLQDTAENDFALWMNDGWEKTDGTKCNSHYYVAEWRSHLGVDEGLKYNARARVEYNRGMLLWYVNNNFGDNWVGNHPGYGQIGVVDANQFVYMNGGLGNGNESGIRAGYMSFVQLHDAAFSLDKAADMDLSIYGWAKNPNLKAKQAVPLFDDNKSYFSNNNPYGTLKLPNLGLQIRVLGNAVDYSRGLITISK